LNQLGNHSLDLYAWNSEILNHPFDSYFRPYLDPHLTPHSRSIQFRQEDDHPIVLTRILSNYAVT